MNGKKKAITCLTRLLKEIDDITGVEQGNNWKSKLKDTLNLYIGDKSAISRRLDSLQFTRLESTFVDRDSGFYEEHIFTHENKSDFKDLINNAINYIEVNGIYRNPIRMNFLSDFKNAEIIGGIVFCVITIFAIGDYFGKLAKEREIIQMELKIKEVEIQNHEFKEQLEKIKLIEKNTIKSK